MGYPVRILILKKYGNTLGWSLDKGKYVKERLKTADGFIETNFFEFAKEKIGGKRLRIPAPEIRHYQNIEAKKGNSTRNLILIQLDRDTYYPVTQVEGKLIVNIPIPLYEIERDAEGNPVLDEEGKYKPLLDSNKNPVQAKNDKGEPVYDFQQRPIFDSDIALDNGKIISLPALIPHRTYDKEHFLSDAIETAERIYRSKSFWEKYGNIIAMAVAGFMMTVIMAVSLTNFGTIADKFVEGSKIMATALQTTSAACNIPAATGVATQIPPF